MCAPKIKDLRTLWPGGKEQAGITLKSVTRLGTTKVRQELGIKWGWHSPPQLHHRKHIWQSRVCTTLGLSYPLNQSFTLLANTEHELVAGFKNAEVKKACSVPPNNWRSRGGNRQQCRQKHKQDVTKAIISLCRRNRENTKEFLSIKIEHETIQVFA